MQSLLKKAFTLLEMMVVVVIVGAIALFAIPNFSKTMSGSYEQNAVTQLTSIHAANNIYQAQNGTYWPEDSNPTHPVGDINTNLSVNIMGNGMTYNCSCTNFNSGACLAYACTATRGTCVITLTQATLSTTNPSATAACATYTPST